MSEALALEQQAILALESLSLEAILAICFEAISLEEISALSLEAIVKSLTFNAKLGDQVSVDRWLQQ